MVSRVRHSGCVSKTIRVSECEGATYDTVWATLCLSRGVEHGCRELNIPLRKSEPQDINEYQRRRKLAPLCISLVKMSEGLHLPLT